MDKASSHVVGIGASAGGIPALESFFRKMPADSGMSFVIVTHLSPGRRSLLHEVIGHFTEMPVVLAEQGAEVAANTVHVMPEGVSMRIEGGRMRLYPLDEVHRERKPIDVFLGSLAADRAENAVGIIMSGGDSDGTLGVKAIKEFGGITMAQVQDGASGPRNPQMPESAIETGLIDFALPAEEMPEKLVQIARARTELDEAVLRGQRDEGSPELSKLQQDIAKLLRSHSGHDFSGYKSKTFFRRVARRMQVANVTDLRAYIDLMRREPSEVMALFRDLLINVTDFFRDGEAFEALEKMVIPSLFEGRGANDSIRVWVPGCATGEEVYSIGMLLSEAREKHPTPPQIQIFATDIDEPALGIARAARYPEELLKNLSPARQSRFFQRDGTSYVLAKEVRDMCVFSPHSVINDPPFSRMDLVSCRNLLIYFGADLQRQVIPTFHYALKTGGYLFLGTSESVSQQADLFRPLDKKNRIFQALEHSGRRLRLPMSVEGMIVPTRQSDEETRRAGAGTYHLRQRTETQVLERHAPAHVVIRKEGEVVFFLARTGRYIEAPRGAPNRDLLELVRRELRLNLRAALREAMEKAGPVTRYSMLTSENGGEKQVIAMTVEPLEGQNGEEPLYLVLFEPSGDTHLAADHEATADAGTGAVPGAELRDLRDRLQSTVEEYETALEELKSSNEELVSVNEEAQSTNEELEASKEEMQSLNEELSTINAELNSKVEELDRANSDLRNLYDATQIATVFLDSKLVVRNFTPAASAFFNLRPSDVGRPLTELASVIDYPELQEHIRRVFDGGKPVEHRLTPDGNGAHYLVRLVPYRSDAGDIGGVVVTFIEISNLARAELHQQILISELNHRVKNMLAIVISITNATRKSAANPREFVNVLIGRLHGMARAYALLSLQSWTQVPIRDLITTETDAHGIERIDADGPDVALRPQQALALGMVVHELATNAAKYGALSIETGNVTVRWDVVGDRLTFNWTETCGPSVQSPEQTGFGLVLIKGQIARQLGGTVETSFDPAGFSLKLSFALEKDGGLNDG